MQPNMWSTLREQIDEDRHTDGRTDWKVNIGLPKAMSNDIQYSKTGQIRLQFIEIL